jgi:hypothetical protein
MILREIGFDRIWPRHNPLKRTFLLRIYRILTFNDASEIFVTR